MTSFFWENYGLAVILLKTTQRFNIMIQNMVGTI